MFLCYTALYISVNMSLYTSYQIIILENYFVLKTPSQKVTRLKM